MRPDPWTTRVARVAADQPSAVAIRATSRASVPWTIPGGRAWRAWRNSVQSARSRTRSSRMARPFRVGPAVAGRGGRVGAGGGPLRVVGLGTPEAPVTPLSHHQLAVCALLHDAAPVEEDDEVGFLDRAQPVGDQDHGLARQGGAEALLDGPLGGGVEVAGRLVEDQDLGPPQECPGDRQPLSLAAGEV